MPIQERRWSFSSDTSEPSAPFPCFPLRSATREDSNCTDLCNSKREYLLAQIKQKDQIIESLLKQVSDSLLIYPVQGLITRRSSCTTHTLQRLYQLHLTGSRLLRLTKTRAMCLLGWTSCRPASEILALSLIVTTCERRSRKIQIRKANRTKGQRKVILIYVTARHSRTRRPHLRSQTPTYR